MGNADLYRPEGVLDPEAGQREIQEEPDGHDDQEARPDGIQQPGKFGPRPVPHYGQE
ncbi:MAG: hypothetical protein V5A25_12110 [Halovenus sp.]